MQCRETCKSARAQTEQMFFMQLTSRKKERFITFISHIYSMVHKATCMVLPGNLPVNPDLLLAGRAK